ncbi:hypothetical protein PYW08_012899 [Mythimna loreyi]|uniref:Uncharacterized protein n=1 Tax=Mythimna loreyi TaxID=667449 RepID=A0ACC2Q225_9NEOP|nr:hypothetical protein PYW08_012899 [Mythimna loreyi]
MTNSGSKLKRREGTSGISGHLYETKLLCLINFRATHEHTIEEFHLVPNVDGIGAFDDICFRVKVEGLSKPIFVFIQAKHKENTKQTLKIDLTTYLNSFINIRLEFKPNHKEWLYEGTFDKEECFFVIYTTAKNQFTNVLDIKSEYSAVVNNLIHTGGTAKRLGLGEQHVQNLCKAALKEQMRYLAKRIAKLIDDGKFQMLMVDETVMRFHVILAQKVVNVSKTKSNDHRIASFRHDFFDTHEEYLTIFKYTLFEEILKERKLEAADITSLMSEFLADPTDATKLSKVIVTVVTFNKGVVEINKKYKEYLKQFTPQLEQVDVSKLTVNQAIQLAAKRILLSPDFKIKVPSSFGNKDLTIIPNETKKLKRIDHLTTIIINLLRECKSDKIVTINESVEKGFQKLNGGIASAIGNIFVLDDDNKLMKVTDNTESLGTQAKQLYESLNEKIKLINEEIELSKEDRSHEKLSNLSEYKFYFKINKFPKLLLECSEYEEQLVRDFLNKLVIYSNQANEESVEEILKKEIIETLTLSDYNQEKIDDIFLKYHNAIQKWWMRPEVSSLYLTKNNQIFEKANRNIIEDPLINSLSAPYIRQIKRYNYKFTEDAVRTLSLDNLQPTTIVTAQSSTLAIVKVLQYLKNKDYAALNVEQIVNLPNKKRKSLISELKTTKKDKVIILVCDKLKDSEKEKKTLENVADAVRNKRTIIVTYKTKNNDLSAEILQRYFKTGNIVHDVKSALIYMNEETQKRVLKSARVKYQDIEIGLEHLVSGMPRVRSVNTEDRTASTGSCHVKTKCKI